MRVIAGDFKGRRLQAMKGDNTRPTTDKVKENVFNIMGQFFTGGRVLDLFAGSGNLGIEALSRGMDEAVFIDMNPNAIRVIKENLTQLKIQDRTEVYRNDAFKALNVLAKKGAKFDLIFLDPPYGKVAITELLKVVVEKNLLNDEGMIMCEYNAGQSVLFDGSYIKETRRESYGNIEILILEKVGK
ncbi:MAG: 16S rRNA (guanine(966)-N(2))-methyltransferase RsmD [Turicibacter sp.]|nr:16S rRNA (guanine(966)-N(2))-methyltransferase RsmD [Turicibacter sp.]